MFPIWGDSCIWCFFSGDLLRPPHPGSRVRPGAMWRWRVSVSGWVRQAVFRRNVRFVLPHIKAGGTPEWRNKSFAGLRHNWGRASSLFICCHIGIPRCKNILWDFAKAIANKRRWNAPCFAYAKHYTPNPLIFYSQKIISLSTLNGNRAIIKRFGKRWGGSAVAEGYGGTRQGEAFHPPFYLLSHWRTPLSIPTFGFCRAKNESYSRVFWKIRGDGQA